MTYKNFLKFTIASIICWMGLTISLVSAQTTTYSETFTNGAGYSAGSPQYDNFETFRLGAPSSNIQSLTISGSLAATSRTCSDPALAQQIMDNFKTSTGTIETVVCNGFKWNTGNCAVSGTEIELNVGLSTHVCACAATNYTLRPRIGDGNQNWGSIGGYTCNGATQTMTVSYSTTSAADPLEVTSTADTNTIGTLRYAINHANANAGDDDITFNISGSGPHVISPATGLPQINDDGVSIDGTSQSGTVCNTLVSGTPHVLKIQIDGASSVDVEGIVMAGDNVSVSGLSITGFDSHAIRMTGPSVSGSVDCSYIGVNPDGTTKNANAKSSSVGSALVLAGDGASITRSVVSGNDDDTGDVGIYISGSTSVLKGNIVGLTADGTMALGNGNRGFNISPTASAVTIGGTSASDRNIISGNNGSGVYIEGSTSVEILGNYIGLAADGNTGIENSGAGVVINNSTGVNIGDGTALGSNIIARNAGDGIQVNGNDAEVTIIANAIHNNDGLGIDLRGATGRDINDGGDLDDGPNDLLNFPVINDFASDGNTAVTYDINLDVPAADYRIDFYKNTVVDVSGYGEGEIHLSFDEFTHSGGNAQHTGALTSNAVVTQGDNISATTTRKTAPSTYDITSEFSLSTITGSPTELIASKSVDVYDPTSAGLYALPGNDVVSSLTITNPGTAPADADTIIIIDLISTEVEFYNGDVDGGGPQSNAVGFVQSSGAGMTFTYVSDVKYSNSGTRPANMGACNYSPAIGYDDNVTFICINPKGALAAGDPDPNFTVSYRTRIK